MSVVWGGGCYWGTNSEYQMGLLQNSEFYAVDCEHHVKCVVREFKLTYSRDNNQLKLLQYWMCNLLHGAGLDLVWSHCSYIRNNMDGVATNLSYRVSGVYCEPSAGYMFDVFFFPWCLELDSSDFLRNLDILHDILVWSRKVVGGAYFLSWLHCMLPDSISTSVIHFSCEARVWHSRPYSTPKLHTRGLPHWCQFRSPRLCRFSESSYTASCWSVALNSYLFGGPLFLHKGNLRDLGTCRSTVYNLSVRNNFLSVLIVSHCCTSSLLCFPPTSFNAPIWRIQSWWG